MLRLFKRPIRATACDTAALGGAALAMRMPGGAAVPRGCVGVVFDKGGRIRRMEEGARLALADHESASCFHPGPYRLELLPFAAAPELGLQITFVVDSADPRVAQQRFDLYLMSEAGDVLALDDFGAAMEAALQRELAQGNLELPPCTTLDEWNVFRAGLNQLCYTRFGVTVDDCVPADLGERVDYARLLLARAADAPVGAAQQVRACLPRRPVTGAAADAPGLRRLFLELPCVMCALRLAVLPPGQALFQQHQALLQRLDAVSLSVGTMPALALAAPGQPLDTPRQDERAAATVQACAALDEAWALLARLNLAGDPQLGALLDEADRIVANLEFHCAARRAALAESGDA